MITDMTALLRAQRTRRTVVMLMVPTIVGVIWESFTLPALALNLVYWGAVLAYADRHVRQLSTRLSDDLCESQPYGGK